MLLDTVHVVYIFHNVLERNTQLYNLKKMPFSRHIHISEYRIMWDQGKIMSSQRYTSVDDGHFTSSP